MGDTDIVSITVIEGKELIPCDKNGASDPYCVVIVGDMKKKTKQVKSTLSPVWASPNEFKFEIPRSVENITFELYDWNRFSKHKRMGMATLPIETVAKNNSHFDDWIQLVPIKADDKVSGSIHVQVSLIKKSLLEENEPPIFQAIRNSDLELVNKILSGGCDVNAKDTYGYTPLHTAACLFSENDDKILLALLQQKGVDVNMENDDKNTPLHYFAAKFRSPTCTEVFEAFMEKDANVNAQNELGETPLHKAIFNNSVRILMVELLLKAGADANKANDKGETALHYAVRLGRHDLVTSLLKGGASIHMKAKVTLRRIQMEKTPYELAVEEDNKEMAALLKKMEDLYTWLESIEMDRYRATFIENEIYKDLVPDLDEKILDAMKITKTGHRLKILKAAKALKDSMSKKNLLEEEKTEVIPQQKSFEIKQNNIEEELEQLKYVNRSGNWIIDHSALEFTTKIGNGSAGTVYKGIYNNRVVAIKLLKTNQTETEIKEFKKEFHILSAIQSPYIVFFFGACLKPKLCMVMEYMTRKSLYDVMTDPDMVIGWDKLFSFLSESIQGIECLHKWEPQIVHRDLKSLNLMVNDGLHVKVGDFGLSRFNTETQGQTLNKMVGTMAYCAPEVYFGQKYKTSADIYSFGIILWEIVSRTIKSCYERPYQEFPNLRFDFQIIIQVAKKQVRPTIPEECPDSVKQLIQRCWSEKPEERPNCKEIYEKLQELREEFEANEEEWNKLIRPAPEQSVTESGSSNSLVNQFIQ